MTVHAMRSLKEATTTKATAFARAFERSRTQLTKLSDEGVREVMRELQVMRAEIAERLKAQLPDDPRAPFTTRILPGLSDSIGSAVEDFSRLSGGKLDAKLAASFDLGGTTTAGALRAAAVPVAFPSVSAELLSTVSAAAGDVLTEISTNLGDEIMRKVRQSAIGLTPASGVVRAVDRMLRDSVEVRKGLRRRIGFAYQAEEITRTELGRVYSSAQQAASEEIAKTIPTLRKSWVKSKGGRVRKGHAEAHVRYAVGGSTGPIKIKEKFEVTDYSRTGRTKFLTLGKRIRPKGFTGGMRVVGVPTYQRRGRLIVDRLLFPRDPRARSPGNVINCMCVSIDIVPDFEEALEKALGEL